MSFYRYEQTRRWSDAKWDRVRDRIRDLFVNRTTHHPDGEPMEVHYPGDPCPREQAYFGFERQVIDEQLRSDEDDNHRAQAEAEWRADVQRGIS